MAAAVVEWGVESESDRALLRRFAASRDEPAFAELVRRYGRVVWGVCRRRLSRREDAEDAFQATFLILAVKAGSIRTPEALPGWLHRTACRAAVRVASTAPGSPPEEVPSNGIDAFAEIARHEAAVAVDEELVRLPRRYRDALVMFHLEELERKDVAERLGASEATVKALLARGRSLLRTRLARRGIALPMVLPFVADPVPAQAAAGACRLGVSLTRGGVSALDLVTVPGGVGAMVPWITSKAAAVALAGAACLSLFIVTRDPARAGTGGGSGDGPAVDTVVAQADVPREETSQIVAAEPASSSAEEVVPPGSGEETEEAEPTPVTVATTAVALQTVGQPIILQTPAEEKIRAALDQETQLEFPGVPLRDVIAFIADKHDINIIIDEVALTDAGVSLDDNVDMVLKGVTLRSALRILLEPYDVTHMVEDEVLKITTQEIADDRIETAAYELQSIAGVDEPEFAEKLQRLLDPDSGRDDESAEPPRFRIERFGNRLVMTGPPADQERLQEYLELLRFGQ